MNCLRDTSPLDLSLQWELQTIVDALDSPIQHFLCSIPCNSMKVQNTKECLTIWWIFRYFCPKPETPKHSMFQAPNEADALREWSKPS